MAVDTAAKRFSMMNFVCGPGVHLVPMWEPDGAVDTDDRVHGLDLYGGITLDTPVTPSSAGVSFSSAARERRRR